jgi:two-component system, cell cycle sensor histidine kinase and response regulator CckA
MNPADPAQPNNPAPGVQASQPATDLRQGRGNPERSEEAFLSSEVLHRTLFELMPGSVVLLDPQGYIRYANPFFCRHMGFSRNEMIGVHVSRFGQDTPEMVEENIRRMLAGEVLEHEVTNIQKDGSSRFYALREAAITLPNGSKAILAVSTDITERKQAEQAKLEMERQLAQMEKMESLTVLTGGIAHDFNNLLTAMLGTVEIAMREMPPESAGSRGLKIALAAGQRAAGLVRQMLDYSGRGGFTVSELDLTQLVKELAGLVKPSIPKSVRVELRLAPGVPAFPGDATQLQRVVIGLITNAAEAIGDQEGVVTVSTSAGYYDAAQLAQSRTTRKPSAGQYVSLEVSDTGCGMDSTVQERLFDPFFSTKLLGRGLGMAAVLGVVQGHQGAIMVSSQPDRGTSIRVLLPISAAKSEGGTPSATPVGTAVSQP